MLKRAVASSLLKELSWEEGTQANTGTSGDNQASWLSGIRDLIAGTHQPWIALPCSNQAIESLLLIHIQPDQGDTHALDDRHVRKAFTQQNNFLSKFFDP